MNTFFLVVPDVFATQLLRPLPFGPSPAVAGLELHGAGGGAARAAAEASPGSTQDVKLSIPIWLVV